MRPKFRGTNDVVGSPDWSRTKKTGDRMTRRASILAMLLLMFALMPGVVGAQTPDEGKGVAADPEVKASAIAFVREFVDRINQRDPVAYDMAVPAYWPSTTTRSGDVSPAFSGMMTRPRRGRTPSTS